MRKTLYGTVTAAVMMSAFVPTGAAGIDFCAGICFHADEPAASASTNPDTYVQWASSAQACGGSGYIIVNYGNNNTYNVCQQSSNQSQNQTATGIK